MDFRGVGEIDGTCGCLLNSFNNSRLISRTKGAVYGTLLSRVPQRSIGKESHAKIYGAGQQHEDDCQADRQFDQALASGLPELGMECTFLHTDTSEGSCLLLA